MGLLSTGILATAAAAVLCNLPSIEATHGAVNVYEAHLTHLMVLAERRGARQERTCDKAEIDDKGCPDFNGCEGRPGFSRFCVAEESIELQDSGKCCTECTWFCYDNFGESTPMPGSGSNNGKKYFGRDTQEGSSKRALGPSDMMLFWREHRVRHLNGNRQWSFNARV
jgi:hypothetical protein